MKETLNTPEWWASFLEWDRIVQLEFVTEALGAEFGGDANVGEEVASTAQDTWEEDRRVHEHSGVFSIPQLAAMLASYDMRVKCNQPLQVELIDTSTGLFHAPLALSGYTIVSWRAQSAAAQGLLEMKFPWIAGWRLIASEEQPDEPSDPWLADTRGIGEN